MPYAPGLYQILNSYADTKPEVSCINQNVNSNQKTILLIYYPQVSNTWAASFVQSSSLPSNCDYMMWPPSSHWKKTTGAQSTWFLYSLMRDPLVPEEFSAWNQFLCHCVLFCRLIVASRCLSEILRRLWCYVAEPTRKHCLIQVHRLQLNLVYDEIGRNHISQNSFGCA